MNNEVIIKDTHRGLWYEDGVLKQVLQHIDNFLPVKELAGRPVDLEVLRQFGLVDNEKVDHFLASAFAKASVSPKSDKPGPQTEPQELVSKVSSTNQSEQNN